jgi:hypothetical protein
MSQPLETNTPEESQLDDPLPDSEALTPNLTEEMESLGPIVTTQEINRALATLCPYSKLELIKAGL